MSRRQIPLTLSHVRIDPASAEQDKLPLGGILWEEYRDAPDWARHLRGNVPADLTHKPIDKPPKHMRGSYIWGGYAVYHFGHFIAEQAPRLLRGGLENPHLKLILLLPPQSTPSDVPKWLTDILSWFGFSKARIQYITDTPVIVDELLIYPQEEHLTSAPTTEYVNLLTNHTKSNLKPSQDIKLTYVSRSSIPGGGLGGERYLEAALAAHGAHIIYPEKLSLSEQLDIYARSKKLLFAEGSAVHGRQLLGYLKQDIHILVRRKGGLFAGRMIRPRCKNLSYIDAVKGSIHFSFDARTGLPKRWEAFPYTDGEALLAGLKSIGINLSSYWNNDDFEEEVQNDLTKWAEKVSRGNSRTDVNQRIRLMEGGLYAVGLDSHATRLADIARSYYDAI